MAERISLRLGDREFVVETSDDGVRVDGALVTPAPRASVVADGDRRLVFVDGNVFEFEVPRQGRRRGTAHHASLTSPMPATVLRINVAPGDSVSKGATLVVLEAMKMELPVRAPSDGVVKSVACHEGQLVQAGVTLVELDD